MILVTVGMQLGFDRLIQAIDDLAPTLPTQVFAQIGKGTYKPRNIETAVNIAPVEFDKLLQRTTLIIAHAGIGTVLTAQRHRKPILLFPRRAALGEHRNDHQLATVKELCGRSRIVVAMDVEDLPSAIGQGLTLDISETPDLPQRDKLRSAIESFIVRGDLLDSQG